MLTDGKLRFATLSRFADETYVNNKHEIPAKKWNVLKKPPHVSKKFCGRKV